MAQDTVRILIVCDQISRRHDREDLFEDVDVPTECVIVSRWDEAFDQIQLWASEGYRADVISADFNNYERDFIPPDELAGGIWVKNGVQFASFVTSWSDEHLSEDLRPGKVFIHSADDHLAARSIKANAGISGRVESFDIIEFNDIISFAYSPSNRAGTRNFRTYLNDKFGYGFPTSESQVRMLKSPNRKIDIGTAWSDIESGTLMPAQALALIGVDQVHQYFGATYDYEALKAAGIAIDDFRAPQAGNFIGDTVAGYLAFDQAQAEALRADGKKVVLVMQDYQPQQMALLGYTDCIILLNGESEHLASIVPNHGVAAALDIGEGFRLRIEDQGDCRVLVGKDDERGAQFSVREFEPITLQNWGTSYTSDGSGDQIVRAIGRILPFTLPMKEMSAVDYDGHPDTRIQFMAKVDEVAESLNAMAVKANADTPDQVRKAVELGAAGIGLLRTEHMFFADEKLQPLRDALLTTDDGARAKALAALKTFQTADFSEIFAAAATSAKDFPVTIRLLDAPPHEFLNAKQVAELSDRVGADNMRGTPLALQTPGLYAMQAEAVFDAIKASGYSGKVDLMLPLVGTAEQVAQIKQEIGTVAVRNDMEGRYGFRAMIETVQAVQNAGEIAALVDGISFGTNDLTAEVGNVKRTDTLGILDWMSRDKLTGKSPFLSLAAPIVALVQQATDAIRKTKSDMDISVCGNQVAGDVRSIEACHKMGLGSISVPAASLYFYPSKIIATHFAVKDSPMGASVAPKVRRGSSMDYDFDD